MSETPSNLKQISSFFYDESKWALEIVFTNGEHYKFINVPPYIFRLFDESDSKDWFFTNFIERVGYSFIKQDDKK